MITLVANTTTSVQKKYLDALNEVDRYRQIEEMQELKIQELQYQMEALSRELYKREKVKTNVERKTEETVAEVEQYHEAAAKWADKEKQLNVQINALKNEAAQYAGSCGINEFSLTKPVINKMFVESEKVLQNRLDTEITKAKQIEDKEVSYVIMLKTLEEQLQKVHLSSFQHSLATLLETLFLVGQSIGPRLRGTVRL
jgi:DNA repair exonuclease SbcCD ATPase subunit